jgi:RNA polymerase sigma-B factor
MGVIDRAPIPEHTEHMAPECEVLVLDHRRLARRLAQRYVRHGEPREDLEQVAYLGLVKAARRFDPDRGVAFTTFAMPTILGELRRFCRDTRWSAHVPRAMQERVQALRRVEDAQAGRAPSAAEAADLLGWSEEEVLETRLAAASLSPQSLDAELSRDGSEALLEALGREDSGFESTERRDELWRALAELTPREQLVLRLRGEGDCSTPQIARHLGLSPSQASRLVTRATTRLRELLAGEPAGAPEPMVRLVQADPELFADLDAAALAQARSHLVARRLAVEPGVWDGSGDGRLLVVRGTLLRQVTPVRAELLGPGDVIQGSAWQVLEPTEFACLDRRIMHALSAWPSAMEALLGRMSRRSDALAAQLAITDQRRVDDRLLSLFQLLGERWGTRTPRGIAIPVPLTHDTIAMLVGAHRPTVTSGLRRLSRDGSLRQTGPQRWLLVQRTPLALAA